MNSIIGKIEITEKQALKLGLEKNNRLSPLLEKCCLRLVANESFEHAEEDIKMTTGMEVSGSSQHRLVQRYDSRGRRERSPRGIECRWRQC